MPDHRTSRSGPTVPPATANRRSEPDPLLASCASVLGWSGFVLERVRLFDQRVTVVAEVDEAAHSTRVEAGWGPVLDRMTLACWEELPELWPSVPPRAVRLAGVMCRDTAWRRALTRAGGFIGFCPTAFLLDGEPDQECLVTAHWYGVGVLRAAPADSVRLVQPGREGPSPTSRPSAITRFAEEQVYQRVLADGLLSAPRAS
jgi:hypothetical protein